MYTRTVITFFCIILLAGWCKTAAFARDGRWNVDAGFQMGFSQSSFRDVLKNNGYGAGVHIGHNFLDSVSLAFGLDLAYMSYGRESWQEPFSSAISGVKTQVERDYAMTQGHLLVRWMPYYPRQGPLVYLDGLLGFNYLSGNTKIENQSNVNGEIIHSVELDNFTLSAGGGFGMMFLVYNSRESRPIGCGTCDYDREVSYTPEDEKKHDILQVAIHMQAHWLTGSTVEYVKPGSVKIDENRRVTYDIGRARTNMWAVRMGISVLFWPKEE